MEIHCVKTRISSVLNEKKIDGMYKVYELTDKERDKTQDFAGMEIHIIMTYLKTKKNVMKKKRDL